MTGPRKGRPSLFSPCNVHRQLNVLYIMDLYNLQKKKEKEEAV